MSVTYNADGYPIYSGGEQYGELIDVEELNVTENGTYTADRGVAYSPVNVNVEGGGGGMDNLLTLHLSFEMPELPEGTTGLKFMATMLDFENEIVITTNGSDFQPILITESQSDLKCYGLPYLTTITHLPDPPYIGTINEIMMYIEGENGQGPYFDAEASTYTHCSWDADNWVVILDEGYTEASIEVKFTNTPPY